MSSALAAWRQRPGFGGAATGAPPTVVKMPATPAASTMSGKGSARKKMPMNAAAATPMRKRVLSARLPMRISASTTMTSTAALMP